MTFSPRKACLWIHRYTGLIIAGFLIIAGITGSLLAFYDDLDERFNHKLAYIEAVDTPQLPIAMLHDRVISAYPDYKFSSMPTSIEPARSAVFAVDRVRGKQANNQLTALFQEVYVDPYTGAIIGTRDREQWAWRNTMYKVFWLHRDLLLGDVGKLILGIVSLVWTINCFIGFYLTLPRKVKNTQAKQKKPNKKRSSWLKRWRPAWKIRTKTNTFKLNYDLHHAFGLWLWVILFVIAWSSVGFNLKEVYQPTMRAVVGLEAREGRPKVFTSEPNKETLNQKNTAAVVNKANSIEYLTAQANIVAQQKSVKVQQLLGIRWVENDGQWQMRFKTDKDIGKKGGASSITVDAATGKVEKVNFGYQNSSFGSKTDQWLSTLHMGHIGQGAGHLLYQVFLVLVGLAVAILSVTGVYLWWRGRQNAIQNLSKGKPVERH